MVARALARKGDKTTHGGVVVTGDPTFILHGQEVARVGDQVSCPRCKRMSRIVTGAPTLFDGQLVALHDSLTDCGAKIIASQSTDFYDDGADDEQVSRTLSEKPALVESGFHPDENQNEENKAIKFQAVDPENGKPLAKRPYIVTKEDGTQFGGITDSEGFTKAIESKNPEQIAIHFMFTDPNGTEINKEDLLP